MTNLTQTLGTLFLASMLGGAVFADQAPTTLQNQPVTATPASSVPAVSKPAPATTKAAPTTEKTGELVARVLWIKGELKATSPDNKMRSLKKTDPVYLHDTLTTDKKSQAQIVFTDDSLMTFRPGSKVSINTYKLNTKGSHDGSYIMDLLEGGFRTITGLIAKANPTGYKIVTPVATIGVRGTDFAIAISDKGELYVAQYKGTPCVSGGKGETLCLNNKTKYAKVPGAGKVPEPLSERPAEFKQTSDVVNAPFADTFGGPGGMGGITTPGGGNSANPLSSSFCIQ